MSKRRSDGYSTYLVGWDDHLVIKAGYTQYRRWREFTSRGAALYHRELFPDFHCAFDLEAELHSFLGYGLDLAFRSRTEALAMLPGGGGWMECYQAPDRAVFQWCLDQCSGIMLGHSCEHCAQPCLTDGRDARTHADPLAEHPIQLQVPDAHEKDGQ